MFKRLCVVVLVVFLLVSLPACGVEPADNATQDTEVIESTAGRETIPSTEGTIPSTEEIIPSTPETNPPTEPTIPEYSIKYKMAPVHKGIVSTKNGDLYELWLAFELVEATELDIICGGSRTSFKISNTSNGDVLTELAEDSSSNVSIDYYIGSICLNDHMTDPNVRLRGSDDLLLLTLKITTDYEVDFEDLKLTCTPLYDWEDYKTFDLEFNADISEITTKQPIIHAETLFELDSKYYISASNAGLATFDFGSAAGISIDFVCIGGTVEDIYSSMSGKTTLVYGPDSEFYQPNGYDSNQTYLCAIEMPEGCEFAMKVSGETLFVGFRSTSGKVQEDSDCEKKGSSSVPMYIFEDGSSMIFLCSD